MSRFTLGGGAEQLRGQGTHDSVITKRMIAERVHQLGGHQLCVAGAGHQMLEAAKEFFAGGIRP